MNTNKRNDESIWRISLPPDTMRTNTATAKTIAEYRYFFIRKFYHKLPRSCTAGFNDANASKSPAFPSNCFESARDRNAVRPSGLSRSLSECLGSGPINWLEAAPAA